MTATAPLVLVPEVLPPDWLASVRAAADAGAFELRDDLDAVLGLGLEARHRVVGLLTLLTRPVDAALLDAFPQLRVVSNMAVGFDNVDVPACTARSIRVGNTPGVLTDATADLAMALLLSAARNLPVASLDAREGRWRTWSPTGWLGLELRGATLGVVGLGKIGLAVAQRARAFGMDILYTRRSDAPAPPELGATRVELDTLLARADVVSLHVPLRPDTRHLIDAAALARMKPSALLVNTARGDVVDQVALQAALEAGQIAGAALDVTSPEPLPPEHPLYQTPGCFIVPHIGSATRATRRRMAELACANLLAGVRGEALPHAVNGPI